MSENREAMETAVGCFIEARPHSIEGYWSICTASIITELIKSAGRCCERYASDLFVDWENIKDIIDSGRDFDGYFIFAMRDWGVDHKEFYDIRMRENTEIYREVWKLTVKADRGERSITMTLEKLM
jgi:hypothetical protein